MSDGNRGLGRTMLVIALAGIWVSLMEFVRNHYREMGLVFPEEPANAVVWALWSLVFAGLADALTGRLGLWPASCSCGWRPGTCRCCRPTFFRWCVPMGFVEVSGAVLIRRRLACPEAIPSR